MADVHNGRVGGLNEGVQRHRPLGDDQPLGELRSADQPEMHRERKPERSGRDEHECRPRDDLNRPVPGEPAYLVT